MELRHIRYFIAVAEELHMGRAAKRLHISQPPLSMQIAALEKELGAKLFLRGSRRLTLTPAGQEFLKHAYHVMADVSLAITSSRKISSGESGTLTLSFIAAMAYSYLPPILKRFSEQFPEVLLLLDDMSGAQQIDALRGGRLQVGFVRPPVADEELSSEIVVKEPYLLAMPEHHPKRRDAVHLPDFSAEKFIMVPARPGWRVHDQSMEICKSAGFTPKVIHEAREVHTLVSLVSAGLGVALVPSSARRLGIAGVRYASLQSDHYLPEAEIAMVWRHEEASPTVHNFLTVARNVLREAQQFDM